VRKPELVQITGEPAEAALAERQAVGDQHPQDADDADGHEVLHQHAEHVLAADHPAVEEREPGRHQQDECGTGEHPRGVAGVDVHRATSPIGCLTRSGSPERVSPAAQHGFAGVTACYEYVSCRTGVT
jgi:hypothetical protein